MNNTEVAYRIRQDIIRLAIEAKTGHIASGLSFVEIISVIFNDFQDPANSKFPHHFILSKGHGAIAYYAALRVFEVITEDVFMSYEKPESRLTTFPTEPYLPGLTFASGSLGHGLGVACGTALSQKMEGKSEKSFCILSDGEIQEGAIWEGVLFAAHNKLSNLVVFVDGNKLQAIDKVENVNTVNFMKMFEAAGWCIQSIDGHDVNEIRKAIDRCSSKLPNIIYADTVKGKGVSFMENSLDWHYFGLHGEFIDMAKKEVGL